MGRVAQRDPPVVHCLNSVMPTASSQAPNSRNGPGCTPARMRAGNNRADRSSRTASEAKTTTASWRLVGDAPVPLPRPKATAGSGGSGSCLLYTSDAADDM
eukprot:13491517-Alexandrium_andersonii.AAC.1